MIQPVPLTRLRAKGPAEFLQSVKGAAGQAAASGGSADDGGAGNSAPVDRGLQ